MRHGEATKLTDKEMKGINIYMKVCTGDVQRVFRSDFIVLYLGIKKFQICNRSFEPEHLLILAFFQVDDCSDHDHDDHHHDDDHHHHDDDHHHHDDDHHHHRCRPHIAGFVKVSNSSFHAQIVKFGYLPSLL